MSRKLLNKFSTRQLSLIKIIGRLADDKRAGVYLVGGIVRDILLDKKNLDLDIVVEGDGLRFAEELSKNLKSHIVSHHRFGTATLTLPDHSKIDIATARKEIYECAGALPKVSFGTIEDDLLRRDFSINALAIRLNYSCCGEMVDFCGGLADLKGKKIKVLHDLSFIEDPTRILRAVRFKERFNFYLEPHTQNLLWEALRKKTFSSVKGPRIYAEIIKLLKEPNAKRAILTIYRLCKWDFLSPAIRFSKETYSLLNTVERQIVWFKKHMSDRRKLDAWLIYFMVLLDGLSPKEKRDLFVRLNLKMGDRKRLESCKIATDSRFLKVLGNKSSKASQVYALLQPLSYETILWVKAKNKSRIIQGNIEAFFKASNLIRISVSGKDLKAMGFQKDREIGKVLMKVLHEKLDRKLAGRKQELHYARKLVDAR